MIPIEMKQLDRWINWKPVGKDKKPLNHFGVVASALDENNWQNFEDAILNDPNHIGFVICGDILCLDGDHEPWITELTNRFSKSTYCEVSPNGGIHVWLIGRYVRNLKHNFEVFTNKRWVTVTSWGNDISLKKVTKDDIHWIESNIRECRS
jgi:hypothetical protein